MKAKQRHGVGGYRAKPSGENPHDFFPTPPGVIEAFALACPLPNGVWCEPAVGDGVIVRTLGARAGWLTFDIREKANPAFRGVEATHTTVDYLALLAPPPVDVVITNPPFYLAEEFVRKALSHSTHVAMLLRLAFLESRKREATDNSAYAWFHWGPGAGGRWKILSTPETTKPEGERGVADEPLFARAGATS